MNDSGSVRLFVAVYPPSDVVKQLRDVVLRLEAVVSPGAIAWTAPEQIHLTLFFLGNIGRALVPEIEAAMDKVCRGAGEFPLQAYGLGCFPGARRPRVIWAGLRGDLARLERLRNELTPDFEKLGWIPESKPFHPHLTIGRAKEMGEPDALRLRRGMEEDCETSFGEWSVDRIDLMQSVLSQRGARHSVARSLKLGLTGC